MLKRACLGALSLGLLLLHVASGRSQEPPAKDTPTALPPGAVLRLGTVKFRHAQSVTSVTFSPDGKVLASADESGVVHLCDTATGRLVLELPKSTGRLLLFTPDSKKLVCDEGGKGLTLRDAASGEVLQTFGNKGQQRTRELGAGGTHAVALSPDGKTLAEANGPLVVLWDMSTGNELRQLKGAKGTIGAVAFSHDGKTVAAGDNNGSTSLFFWDAKTGEETQRIAEVHERWTTALTYSSDGKYFASASPYEVVVWDTDSRKKLAKYKSGSPSLAFSPDNKLLAVPHFGGGDDQAIIDVYKVTEQKPLYTLRGHVTIVNCVAFSSDSKKIATGGREGTVRLWDAATGRELPTGEAHQAEINSVAFSPNGSFAATAAGGDHSIRIWGTASGAPLVQLTIPCRFTSHWCPTSHGWNLAFSQDGKALVCDDKVFDVVSGRVLADLPGSPLAHSADGKLMAGVASDRNSRRDVKVSVWERATGQELVGIQPFGKEANYDTSIAAAAFSPDVRLLAVGVNNGRDLNRGGAAKSKETVFLYKVATGKLLSKFRLSEAAPHFLLFSPNGQFVATAALWQEPVQLWRIADGGLHAELRGEEEQQHWSEFRPVAFSPDGKLLATGGKDNSIVIWDVLTGKLVHRLTGHQKPVRALAFSPDGRRLVSGAGDTQGFIWTLAPLTKKGELSAKDLERLWGELGGEDSAAAYRAAWTLAAAPEKTIPFLKERLKPLSAPDLSRVPRLLKDLDSVEFEVRQAAYKELYECGPAIVETLRKTLDGKPSAEVRKSVEMLLSELHEHPIPPRELHQLRAIQVLEWLEAPAAAELLEPLARGSQLLQPTRDAEAALRRLKSRGSSPKDDKPAPAARSKPSQPSESHLLSNLKAEITSLAFTADGKRLAVVTADGVAQLLDPVAGKELRQFKVDDKAVLSAMFSPDGTVLATGGQDHKIHLWNAETGESLKVLEGHTAAVASVAFAPDGKLLASGSWDSTVRLWDPSTGQLVRKLEGGGARVISVAFSPDGKTIAAGDSDERVNKVAGVPYAIYLPEAIHFWDVASGRPLAPLPREGHQVAFSPDGKLLATADLSTVLLVGGEGGIRIEGKNNTVGAGQGAATIKGRIALTLRDRASGQQRLRLAGKGTALAFSPDGRYLATARGTDLHQGGKILDTPGVVAVDGRLRLFEIATTQEVLAFPEAAQPVVLAFAPDGRSLVAGMKDGAVVLWNLKPKPRDGEAAAPGDEDFERLWNEMASDDAAAAYRALWRLRSADKKVVPILAQHLRPARSDDPKVRRLLADLEAEQFAVREAACKELERRGADVEPVLRDALPQATTLALRQQILQLLNAPGIIHHADGVARQRTIALLEALGTAEARDLLEELAKGPALLEQTQEAKMALSRLKRR